MLSIPNESNKTQRQVQLILLKEQGFFYEFSFNKEIPSASVKSMSIAENLMEAIFKSERGISASLLCKKKIRNEAKIEICYSKICFGKIQSSKINFLKQQFHQQSSHIHKLLQKFISLYRAEYNNIFWSDKFLEQLEKVNQKSNQTKKRKQDQQQIGAPLILPIQRVSSIKQNKIQRDGSRIIEY